MATQDLIIIRSVLILLSIFSMVMAHVNMNIEDEYEYGSSDLKMMDYFEIVFIALVTSGIALF